MDFCYLLKVSTKSYIKIKVKTVTNNYSQKIRNVQTYVMYKCHNICIKNQEIHLLKSYTSVSPKPLNTRIYTVNYCC